MPQSNIFYESTNLSNRYPSVTFIYESTGE
jgi:hypothetical protein